MTSKLKKIAVVCAKPCHRHGHTPPMSATQPRLCSPLSLAFAWLPSADVHGRGRPPLHLSSATPLLFHKKKNVPPWCALRPATWPPASHECHTTSPQQSCLSGLRLAALRRCAWSWAPSSPPELHPALGSHGGARKTCKNLKKKKKKTCLKSRFNITAFVVMHDARGISHRVSHLSYSGDCGPVHSPSTVFRG